METIDLTLATGAVHRARTAGSDDGELVLLLHGFPETSYEWRHLLPVLADAGYRAVAVDQRGYTPGARPSEVDAYRCEHLVADVGAFADALGADRFHLVGHDWGGFVAWWAAPGLAARLLTLTVVSVPHPLAFHAAYHGDTDQRERSVYMDWFRTPEAEAMLLGDDCAALKSGLAAAGTDATDEYARFFSADDGAALTGALNWYRANDFTDDTGRVTTPTMYVWSDADISLGPDAAHATADFVDASYRFEVLAGVTHWVPEEAPDRLHPLVLDHLATGSAAGASA